MTFAPLAGLKVLDMSRLIPGGLATRRLADLGADVVKVEEPGRGDYLRTIPPLIDGIGIMHLSLNRGKRSVVLDIHVHEDRQLFDQLAAAADVIVEVSRPGRYAELGIDFAAMRAARPELVVCSVTGFGQDGPEAASPSHGMNMDALAGCVQLDRSGGTIRLARGQISLAAELGGVNAALAIVAAVMRAKLTGQGAWLDASCWDAAVEANRLWLGHLAATDAPLFDIADLGALYNVYETSDGRVVLIAFIEHKFFASFCRGVGREDLLTRWEGQDVSFAADDDALAEELRTIFTSATATEWHERFQAWDLPGTEVLDHAAVLDHPHLTARRLIEPDPQHQFPAIGSPIRALDEGRAGADLPAAPALGEHTADVLADWLSDRNPRPKEHPQR